jgi:REP element-mobilizing transposase RayT
MYPVGVQSYLIWVRTKDDVRTAPPDKNNPAISAKADENGGAKFLWNEKRFFDVIIHIMHKTLGYLLTWTTYGTWLQGDKRKFVKDGETRDGDEVLFEINQRNLSKEPVTLTQEQRKIVADAICAKADDIKEKILALAVCSNHVHVVAGYTTTDLESIVQYYKAAAQMALRNKGLEGKLWTRGFDKRFCFDESNLRRRIDYVRRQSK